MTNQRICPNCGYSCGIENNFCPHCGRNLEAIQPAQSLCAIAQERALWHPSAFERFPSVIAHEYWRLYQLCLKDKPYGVLLQIKDLMETVLKFEVIAAIAWGMSQQLTDFEQVACQITTPAMSLGRWCALGGEVRRYFREHARPGLPSALWKPLQTILSAYEENKLVSWRNQHIGHGALGFSEDAAFQQDIRDKLTLFGKLFQKLDEPLSSQRMLCGDEVLMGHRRARALSFTGEIVMVLPDGQRFPLDPFIRMLDKLSGEVDDEYDIYFYDNQSERVRQSEMLSYPSGRRRHQQIGFFQELYDQNRRLGSLNRNAAVDAQFRTQEQDDALNQLNLNSMEYAFVVPDFLTEWLGEQLSGADRGVFLLKMYRGTGKSTFTEMLSCLNANPLRLADDLDVRTYHINRSQLISADDFETAVESLWERAYQQPAWSGSSMTRIRDYRWQQGMGEAQALLAFLGQCRQYTARLRQKQRIMLVIDGLDEITDDRLWPYLHLPSDALPEGVYVLFTSRCTDQTEEGVSAEVCRRILSLPGTAMLEVDRRQDDYLSFLNKYIRSVQLDDLTGEETSFLLSRADWRVLYLGMLCKLLESGVSLQELDSDESLAKVYLDTLSDRYGEKEAGRLKELLCILCTFGECEALSLQEIANLTWNRGLITTDLLGKLNDLAPLLKVQRGFLVGSRQYTGVNRYAFANGDLALALRNLLPEADDIAQESIRIALESIIEYMQDAAPDSATANIGTSLMAAGGMFTLLEEEGQRQLLRQHPDTTSRLLELAKLMQHEADLLTMSRLERLFGGLARHIDPDFWQERAQVSHTLAQLYALTGRAYQALELLDEAADAVRQTGADEDQIEPFLLEIDICKSRIYLDMQENLSEAERLAQRACSRMQLACIKGMPSNIAVLADGYLVLAEIETQRLQYAHAYDDHLRCSQTSIHYYRMAVKYLQKSNSFDFRKMALLYEHAGDLLWKLTSSMGIIARLFSFNAVKLYRNADSLLNDAGHSPYLQVWRLRLQSKICRCLQARLFGRKKLIPMQRDICKQYEQLDSNGWLPNRFHMAEAYLQLAGMNVSQQECLESKERARRILMDKQEQTPLSMVEMNAYLDLCMNSSELPQHIDQLYSIHCQLMSDKARLDQQLFEESLSTRTNVQSSSEQLINDLQFLKKAYKRLGDKEKLKKTRQQLKKTRRSRRKYSMLSELGDVIGPRSMSVLILMTSLWVFLLNNCPFLVADPGKVMHVPSLIFTLLICTGTAVWITAYAFSLLDCLILKWRQKRKPPFQRASLKTLWRDQFAGRLANAHLSSLAVLFLISFVPAAEGGLLNWFIAIDPPTFWSISLMLVAIFLLPFFSKWLLIFYQYFRLRYRLHLCKAQVKQESMQKKVAHFQNGKNAA